MIDLLPPRPKIGSQHLRGHRQHDDRRIRQRNTSINRRRDPRGQHDARVEGLVAVIHIDICDHLRIAAPYHHITACISENHSEGSSPGAAAHDRHARHSRLLG